MIANDKALHTIGCSKLNEAMKLANFGTKFEKNGILNVAFILVDVTKGSINLENHRRILKGIAPSNRPEDRPNHWELQAIYIASAMIYMLVYDNLYMKDEKAGLNIADSVFKELLKVGAVQRKDDSHLEISLYNFSNFILQLEKWHPNGMFDWIYVNNKVIKIKLKEVYGWYDDSSKKSSGIKGFLSNFMNNVDTNAPHPIMKIWLSDIVKTIRSGNKNEIVNILKCLLDGLNILCTGVEPEKDETQEAIEKIKDIGAKLGLNLNVKVEEPANPVNTSQSAISTQVNSSEPSTYIPEGNYKKIPNKHIIVSHNEDDEVDVKETDNFYVACAMQMATLIGSDVETCLPIVRNKKEDLKAILNHLLTDGKDRLCNDEEEVYIFLMRGRKSFR